MESLPNFLSSKDEGEVANTYFVGETMTDVDSRMRVAPAAGGDFPACLPPTLEMEI